MGQPGVVAHRVEAPGFSIAYEEDWAVEVSVTEAFAVFFSFGAFAVEFCEGAAILRVFVLRLVLGGGFVAVGP